MIVASASFSVMNLFVKMSGSKLPLFEQILSRNLFVAVLSFFLLKRAGLSFLPEKENIKDLFLRCLFGFIAMVAVFYANRYMLLTDAQILQKLSPFLVAFFAWVLSKEGVSRRTVLGMALAFLGAIFVIGPSGKFANPATIAGLASAVFSALAYSYIHKLTGKEPGLRIIFLFSSSASWPLSPCLSRVLSSRQVKMRAFFLASACSAQLTVFRDKCLSNGSGGRSRYL